MLKLGELKISGMFVGDTKIKKAFLGTELVYEVAKPSRLPEGYTELEYIQSGNGQAINTGVLCSYIYRIEMDVEPIGSHSDQRALFGASYYSGKYYEFSCQKVWYASLSLHAGMNAAGYNASISGDFSNTRLNIVFDRNSKTFSVNGQTATYTNYSNVPYNCYLLTGYKGTNGASFNPISAKLYSCKIYGTDSALVRDYVPCKNPSGAVGLYDVVENKFYTNADSGVFAPGPDV